jgi:hypothetical protein
MECLLCFETWLDQSTFWEIGDESEAAEAEDAIGSMMKLIVKWPQQKGNEWNKVSTPHEIMHIVRFIVVFGGWLTWLQRLSPRGRSQGTCKASR